MQADLVVPSLFLFLLSLPCSTFRSLSLSAFPSYPITLVRSLSLSHFLSMGGAPEGSWMNVYVHVLALECVSVCVCVVFVCVSASALQLAQSSCFYRTDSHFPTDSACVFAY